MRKKIIGIMLSACLFAPVSAQRDTGGETAFRQLEKEYRLGVRNSVAAWEDYLEQYQAWGSQEGERALALVGRTIQECLREHDVAVRYGGEEFGVLLHGTAMPVAQIGREIGRASCRERV